MIYIVLAPLAQAHSFLAMGNTPPSPPQQGSAARNAKSSEDKNV